MYPLDFTKTRLAASTRGTYRGIIDCVLQTVRHDGALAMYRGIAPALGSIVPAVGVELAMYEAVYHQRVPRMCIWDTLDMA